MPTASRNVITSYGNGGFRIGEHRHEGSLIVFPDAVMAWPVAGMPDVTPAVLAEVVARSARVDILLLGCGEASEVPPREVREFLRPHGIVVDAMTTGAACRTYNILMAEERLVAAALMAV
ncbi:MAG: Mth938-like domain-containing protein [bacterium]|nr:Mth938-like domain-containing protein [bacterium]MDE0242311.1 Mth938-like domain-containing protein [bacterium]MDE0417515.1 Mth938-like domain-containing protein [bacterium]